jgi:hypothetical protein
MPDRATGGRANKAVVTGDVAGDATDRRAFKTALGVGRDAHQSDCKRQSGATQKILHWQELHRCGLNPRQWQFVPGVGQNGARSGFAIASP